MAHEPARKRQIDKFRDAARELETDDDGARFDERLKRLVDAGKPKAGHWRVESPRGSGRAQARFHPDDPTNTWGPSQSFNSTTEADSWLQERGCRQDPSDPDIWYDQ
jgi:hypothetical protein